MTSPRTDLTGTAESAGLGSVVCPKATRECHPMSGNDLLTSNQTASRE